MMSTNTAFKHELSDSENADRVTYEYSITPGRFTTENVTISLFDFSKADPIENEINPSLREAQGLVWNSIQDMISALKEGNRPSIVIPLASLNQPPKEDLFWIRASQINLAE